MLFVPMLAVKCCPTRVVVVYIPHTCSFAYGEACWSCWRGGRLDRLNPDFNFKLLKLIGFINLNGVITRGAGLIGGSKPTKREMRSVFVLRPGGQNVSPPKITLFLWWLKSFILRSGEQKGAVQVSRSQAVYILFLCTYRWKNHYSFWWWNNS